MIVCKFSINRPLVDLQSHFSIGQQNNVLLKHRYQTILNVMLDTIPMKQGFYSRRRGMKRYVKANTSSRTNLVIKNIFKYKFQQRLREVNALLSIALLYNYLHLLLQMKLFSIWKVHISCKNLIKFSNSNFFKLDQFYET